ncbi:30S ribosomal protein S12 methylthiotransferase RimO [bacterium]|nr:30S ribosomal protein S12 methylthiotransferase RimO [bacterium]
MESTNKKATVSFVSLGCPKLLVDTEMMMGALNERGYDITFDTSRADIVVINTCSFLEVARRESFAVIDEFIKKKRIGRISRLFVAGCLPELMGQELDAMFPEVDGFVSLKEMANIVEIIESRPKSESISLGLRPHRLLSTASHTAYLKIADGCDNCCTYCLIPKIRGPLVSRSLESIIDEARRLAELGVLELNLIAQDVTAYGHDLPDAPRLPQLLKQLCDIDGIQWIRLLYAHPKGISDELIQTIARHEKVCKYIDMPIQHSENRMLKLMNRRVSRQDLVRLVSKLREAMPEIVLRTTVMVGFPGETEAEFEGLHEFVKTTMFDRLVAFTYSREDGTHAASMPEQVPKRVADDRNNSLLKLQAGISLERNSRLVGKEHEAIIDRVVRRGRGRSPTLIGRTRGQAPDVDGVLTLSGNMSAGEIVRAVITRAGYYDLHGRLAWKPGDLAAIQ